MNIKTISELGQAPEIWTLLPCPLTFNQMKVLRRLRLAGLIDCRPVPVPLPAEVGMEWRMSRQEIKRHREG
ncbi:hypothetical protein EN742_05940 [Mesorhizobium sp. M4A.F.Ca.ET.020.02.1.1]|uniref:hypothetical protein n=1 Tax=unclassified Mesorhizobium TaxID=325217 RepID=UPI000FD4601E|nr:MULTISPECIES: hypothetical protein [unclassified Mesorhizobium]RVD43065.1 hypothetical protein EN742_05940 [Mesorhizobium sp. M4A.F.Ca.ET.020.02.1.1]RWC14107.1 MAG: hypothetical protein EOS53_23075 [Mesorhizobium sp.]RWD33162.1 MAG: hypothetical protein EOS33_12070 [Mesorhizobium sp.]